jgi:tRNA pseudouridine(38-40) synthase
MKALKFKLTIAYDGTNYAGWQLQKIGLGVQQKIEEALGKLFAAPFRRTVPVVPTQASTRLE